MAWSPRLRFALTVSVCVIALHSMAPQAFAANAPGGGGGTCVSTLEGDGSQGQQQAYNNGLYTCTSTTWTPEALMVGSILSSGSAATCNSTYAGLIEWTGSAFQGCNGSSWVGFSAGGGTITLGTSASATNPQRSGQAGTGEFSAATNSWSVATNGTEAMRVDSSQRVGIGTTSPAATLDVNGTIDIKGNNGVWQDAANGNFAAGGTALPSTISQSGGGVNGQNNTALGYAALNANTTGQGNTAAGAGALELNTEGGDNTAVGYGALILNTTGAQNTAVGEYALKNNTSASSNTAIGYTAMFNNTTGYRNTAMGHLALYGLTTGAYNTAIGYWAGFVGTALTTGTFNTYVGDDTQASSAGDTNSTVIGSGGVSQGSNTIVFGNTSVTALYAQVTSINGISDRRHKKDVQDIDLGLAFITKLKPVSYRYNNGDETLRYGFIAQDVETALPDSLHDLIESAKPAHGLALVARGGDKDHTYSMGYTELISPVVKAIQELKSTADKQYADLKQQIAALSSTSKPVANGVLNLSINAKAPVTCEAKQEGAVAYTGTTTHYLCFCDGKSWKQAGSPGTACAW